MSRPNSSLGARKPNGPSLARPATSLDTHAEDGGSVLGKRKGMPSSSLFFPSRSLSCPLGPPVELRPDSLWKHQTQQAPSSGFQPTGMDTRLPGSALNGSLSQSEPCGSLNAENMERETVTPKPVQPSRVPTATPTKPSRAPAVSPSRSQKKPPVPLFLSRYSSVTSFDHNSGAEWDQERREKNMEEMFAAFMTQMNQQGQQSSGLKETVGVYKSRSEFEGVPEASMVF